MLFMRAQFAFVLALAGLLWLPGGILAQNPPVQEQGTSLAPPEPAAALAQAPSGQTVVTYQNGELTIRAWNARLIDVLRAVCTQTGAVLDNVPPGTDERIFAILGPGRAREVLGSLLVGAPFNYVIVESASDPNGLARIMVFPKTKVSKAENQVKQPPGPTRAASVGEKAPLQKQTEPPTQARARASQAGSGDIGHSDVAGMAADASTAELLRQVQEQIKAAVGAQANDTSSSQYAPQVDTGGPGPPGPGRPRHRRR